jgi:hypothetical protein
MTHPVLAGVLADVRNPSPTSGPRDLLAALADIDRPMELLTNWDRCQTLCSAFSDEYSFIHLARAAGARPSVADMQKWSALLRWMLEELTGWNPAGDPHQRTLAAVFVAGTMSDIDHELWNLLPSTFAANRHLSGTLRSALESCRVVIDAPLNIRAPISTKAAVDRFAAANAAKDWKEINDCLDSFGDYISASLLQAQAARILSRCGNNDLLDVISRIDDALLAVTFVDAIADEDTYLALAVSCASPHFEYAALRHAATRRGHPQPAGPGLDELLIKMSADPNRWRDLMDVFNRYPVRYPRLQEALGRALANSSLEAMEAYVEAIQLNNVAINDPGRENVATCLRAFQAHANSNQRETLWRLAYDRWSAWDFGRSDPNTHLFEIRTSLLDYAIVGYAIECLGANAAMQARIDIATKALSLHQNWYLSSSAMVTDWNRSLSSFQPFGHTEHILAGNNEDWLCKARNYLPVDTQTDYLKLKYRMS